MNFGIGPVEVGLNKDRWNIDGYQQPLKPGEWYPGEYEQIDESNGVQNPIKIQKLPPPFTKDSISAFPKIDKDIEPSHPVLKQPEEVNEQQVMEFLQKIEKIYVKYDRLFKEALDLQRELREMDQERAQERIRELQQQQQQLRLELDRVWEQMTDQKTRTKLLNWFDQITSMFFLGTMILCAGLSAATGGASLGAASLAIAAAAGKGGVSIVSGILKYQTQKIEAEMVGVDAQRKLIHTLLTQVANDAKAQMDAVITLSKTTRKFLEENSRAKKAFNGR